MKILRVITRMNIGGPALQAIELTKRLQHNTVLLYGQVADGEKQVVSDVIKPLNKINTLIREISLVKDFKTFLLLRRLIKYHRPDVVHTHMSKAGALTRLAAITVKNRPKLVHTFHGTVLDEYFGWFKSFVFKRVERFLAKYTDALIAISPQQHNDIITRYKIARGKKVRLVRLGFDLSEFDKVYKQDVNKIKADNIVRIGIVGRIAPIKNHKFFIEVLGQLRTLLLKHNRDLFGYVIGGGTEKDAEDLRMLARANNIPIVFYNYVEHKYMPIYYSIMDLVLCVSKNEGTPVALIEAAACGINIESVNVGGVLDILGRYPLLDSQDDAETAAGWLYKKYFKDGCFINDYMLNERQEKVMEKYSVDRLVKDIDSLYKELVL